MTNRLWYTTPAAAYMAGLPVGNGRLAAMVLGDPACERLALNHEWLWRGCHRLRECAKSAHQLGASRRKAAPPSSGGTAGRTGSP